MSRRLANITLDNLGDLPPGAGGASSGNWTRSARPAHRKAGDPALEKESWVSSVLLEWGSCGKIAYVDGVPAGYMLYAPPQYVPRSVAFPTSPVSADAVLLMTAHILGEFAGGGLGRMLVQGDGQGPHPARRQGHRGLRRPAAGSRARACCPRTTCSRWASRRSARTTTTRGCGSSSRTVLTWREDVEVALERLLGSMTPGPASCGWPSCEPVRRPAHPGGSAQGRVGRRVSSDEVGELAEQSRLGLGPDDLLDDLAVLEDTFRVGMFMIP